MDSMLITLGEVKEILNFDGTNEEFIESGKMLRFCIKNDKIIKISTSDLPKEILFEYTDYISKVTKNYLKKHPDIHTWDDFIKQKDTMKSQKMLFEYGVRSAVFDSRESKIKPYKKRSTKNLTLPEFYEACQIQFHYEGSLFSFTKYIARIYGSFAEYCLIKGYDINNTNWENSEAALRVARKLGSESAIKEKSKSLYQYLIEKNLLQEVFKGELPQVIKKVA